MLSNSPQNWPVSREVGAGGEHYIRAATIHSTELGTSLGLSRGVGAFGMRDSARSNGMAAPANGLPAAPVRLAELEEHQRRLAILRSGAIIILSYDPDPRRILRTPDRPRIGIPRSSRSAPTSHWWVRCSPGRFAASPSQSSRNCGPSRRLASWSSCSWSRSPPFIWRCPMSQRRPSANPSTTSGRSTSPSPSSRRSGFGDITPKRHGRLVVSAQMLLDLAIIGSRRAPAPQRGEEQDQPPRRRWAPSRRNRPQPGPPDARIRGYDVPEVRCRSAAKACQV